MNIARTRNSRIFLTIIKIVSCLLEPPNVMIPSSDIVHSMRRIVLIFVFYYRESSVINVLNVRTCTIADTVFGVKILKIFRSVTTARTVKTVLDVRISEIKNFIGAINRYLPKNLKSVSPIRQPLGKSLICSEILVFLEQQSAYNAKIASVTI